MRENIQNIKETENQLIESRERLVKEVVSLNSKLSNIGSVLMVFGAFTVIMSLSGWTCDYDDCWRTAINYPLGTFSIILTMSGFFILRKHG